MTGTEIRNRASDYMGTALDDEQVLVAINNALLDMGDAGLVYADATITTTGGEWKDLPTGCTNVLKVYDSNGDAYEGYQIVGDEIMFDDADTYTLKHRRLANALTALSQTPEINGAFHGCLVSYVIAWSKLQEDAGSRDGAQFMAKFERDVAKTGNLIRRKRTPAYVGVIR